MNPHEDRRGDRRWLVVLAASCGLLLVAVCWQLLVPATPAPDAAGWIVAPVPDVTPSPSPSPPTGPRTEGTDHPGPLWSSRPARSVASGSPAASEPRRLVISRLGISMPVLPTGLASGGQMALPEHPQQVGWYRYGPQPGDASGSVVLGGHVDSRAYGIGPLAALGRLERGDRIVVQQAAGRQVYRVRSVQLISKRALPVAALFDRGGPAALRILTCGGPYNPSRGGYQDNLVVTAVPW
jgi:hypothetical protein